MALPALEKYALFLVILLLIYTGYAFRIRDGGLLVSSEQPHGTCNSVRGKCLDKIVGDLILPSKKYQSLSSIEKLDKVQLLHIENNEKWMFGRTKKLSSVKVEHGLRKLKVSKFETSISKGKDEDKEAFPDSLGKGSEDEENNTEDIEAESDKSAMDDMNNNGDGEVEGEERKNNKSEEGEEKDEKGADKVEFVKEDDDDQKKAGEGIPEKEVIDYDIGSNANQDEGRKNVSEETFREKTHKHVFKLKETRLLKKMLESKNLNTDHFPSTVSPHVQPEILADKPTVVHILNNDSKESIISKYTQKSEVETADAKLTAKVDKKTNATEKDVALKSAPQSPSTLKKKLMPSENSKHLADTKKPTKTERNYSERIIMSFSLKRTMKSLFWKYSCGSGEITCIHGIRSLATIALYIAHKLIPLSSIPYSNRIALTEVANTPISSILRVSLVYTDSFLLLSGVLTAYNMAKERKIHGEIRWFCRIIARFIRLTPALIAIIFWYAFVMEHIGTGPQWNSAIKANADICKKNAWTNLLYIQNFFPFEEMCATHTHQLALDMQLSLIVPMLVFFLEIKPVIGILLIFFLLQLSATLRYLSTVNNNLSLVIFHGMTLKRLYKTANLTYILPLHRATPYLFGVGLGVLMNYTGRSIKLHKVFSILGWLIASALGSWSLFSPWKYARRDFTYDVEEAAYYAVISPVFSALALSWVIFACFTDHGGAVNKILSNYWLVVFSRISYAIYLSQFAVFFYNIGTTRYSSEFQVHTAIDPFEAMVVVAVSTVLTLLFDIPLQEVKNIIMECTGGLRTAEMLEQASKEEHERKMKDLASNDERRVRVIDVQSCDEHEEEPNRRNWRKGTFRELTTHQKDENIEQYSVIPPRPRRQVARRQSLIKMDQINRFGIPRNLADGDEADRRSRSSFGTLIKDLKTADDNLSSDMRSQASNNIGLKDNDDFTPGMIRRERFSPKRTSQREGVPSWELVGKNRAEAWRNSRSSRSLLKYAEARLLSSESEEDDHPKLRRRVQESRLSGEEKLIYNEEEFRDDDQDFPRRRSSAEGKMALLRDPVGQEMTLWTVSKVSQLESSQETSDMEDNEINIRKGKVKKSSFSETPSEEENNWELSKKRSLTTGSQFTSVENDGSVSTFDFVLWKDSERIPIQELSKLPQEEDELECGWNLIRTPDMEITKSSSGLFKRQSIIKSQASEEDPGYLLPERPKLVQQEQEHPFKKAWQEQKSRSEEDSYTVKEAKENKEKMEFRESKDKDTKEVKQHSDNVVKIEQSRQIGPLLDE
ncbi:uncharacterized protein LOC117172978 isoform X5 [Belonocnema kinseyi]|uniref:uncharacterized protein LOC117172978 isoform X5 n=1 Tax=Belonocnema kinseyi TaxID=2817044 RepID=UPI00143D9FF1|nr:uncharacterized protein LOC117172978 isoform X5 [Belonocnema kinseyi]